MSVWRKEAIKRLPRLRQAIEGSESVGVLWIELWHRFTDAHRSEEPDDVTIEGIYQFARWCRNESHNDDVLTTVMTHFYEDLPTDKYVCERIHSFMAKNEFIMTGEAFKYHLSSDEHEQFMRQIAARPFRAETISEL